MSFQNIRSGDRVTFKQYAGRGRNGPEFKNATAKVNPLLIFDDHVVVNTGGKHGKPQVVNAANFVSRSGQGQ